jgi:hypothetical protein
VLDSSELVKAGKDEANSDDDYEYVSSETVHEMIIWVYKVALHLSFFFKDVTSLQDVNFTLKTILSLIVANYLSGFFSDASFLFIIINVVLLWPLAYQKKRAQIDKVFGLINHTVDQYLSKLVFLKKFEQPRKQESKKEK